MSYSLIYIVYLLVREVMFTDAFPTGFSLTPRPPQTLVLGVNLLGDFHIDVISFAFK
jgi:hypothetical protein